MAKFGQDTMGELPNGNVTIDEMHIGNVMPMGHARDVQSHDLNLEQDIKI